MRLFQQFLHKRWCFRSEVRAFMEAMRSDVSYLKTKLYDLRVKVINKPDSAAVAKRFDAHESRTEALRKQLEAIQEQLDTIQEQLQAVPKKRCEPKQRIHSTPIVS